MQVQKAGKYTEGKKYARARAGQPDQSKQCTCRACQNFREIVGRGIRYSEKNGHLQSSP
jgi:hypothetical protein